MKASKKVFALLLALVMTMALAVTAFAADAKGSITVENPVAGSTYKAYKIFDVEYNADKSAYSYTIKSDSEWYNVVKNAGMGLTLTESAGQPGVYVVSVPVGFSAAKFAELLKGALDGKTGIEMTDGKASDLDLGYYLVTPVDEKGNTAICNLTTTEPNVTIRDKNDVTFEKTDDKADVEVGEVVHYTIKGKLQDATGYDSYTYFVTDTMSEGLTYNNDFKITMEDGSPMDPAYYTINSPVGNGFTVNFFMERATKEGMAGKGYVITYSATVNEKAVAVVSDNKAELKYSNDPTDGTKTTTTVEKTTVYSAQIVIDKHKTGEDNTKLAGAQFVLKNADGKFYKYDGQKVTWVDAQKDATVVTTTENGAATFKGLKNGTYSMVEIKAPQGYNLLPNEVTVTVNGSDTAVGTLSVTAKVANSTGNVLPGTGGIGTTIFYVVGGLLVVAAAVLLISKKRMSSK